MIDKCTKLLSVALFLIISGSLLAQEVAGPAEETLLDKLKALTAEIEAEGASGERYENLGDLYTAGGDLKRAVLAYQKAVEEFEGTENRYYKLARVLLAAQRPELGLEILKIGVKSFPESGRLNYELASAYTAFGKHYAATAALAKACEVEPGNDSFRYQLALSYRAQSKTLKAMEIVDAMMEEGSEYVPVYLLKGDLLLIDGDERSAVRVLEDVYEKNPDSSDAKRVLNHAYQQYAYKEGEEGRLGRAIRTLEKAAEIFPNDPETQTGLALYYRESGDNETAEAQYKKVLENSPEYLDIYLLYASFLKGQDKKAEADAMLQKGLEAAKAANNQHYVEQYQSVVNAAN